MTITVAAANALTTGSPLTDSDLHQLREHFLGLEALLRVSGPAFANPRMDAARLHNTAIARLRENAAQRQRREQIAEQVQAGLTEIEL